MNKEAVSLMDYNNKKSPRTDHAVNNVTFNDIDQDVIRIRDPRTGTIQSKDSRAQKKGRQISGRPTVSVSRVRIKTFGISSNTSIHKLGNVLLAYFSVALCE